MDLEEIEGVEWIDLAQDRDKLLVVVKTVMTFRGLIKLGEFLVNWLIVDLSRISIHRVEQSSASALLNARRHYPPPRS